MSHTTAVRRTASALGACALLASSWQPRRRPGSTPGTGGRDFDVVPSRTRGPRQVPRSSSDDDAVEYVQVGAGIVAGMALAGAGAALVSRRRHHDLTPV